MKWALSICLTGVALAFFGCRGGGPVKSLEITSNPPGAIFVNGQEVGESPYTLVTEFKKEAGKFNSYLITAKKQGFSSPEPIEFKYTDRQKKLTIELRKDPLNRLIQITCNETATILVNNSGIGEAPVTTTLQFQKLGEGQYTSFLISATMNGYFCPEPIKYEFSDTRTQLNVVVKPDPVARSTTETGATNKWLAVEVHKNLPKEAAWKKLVDSITSRYPEIETMDQAAGYLRTAWLVKPFYADQDSKDPSSWCRFRFICKIGNENPLSFRLKIESYKIRRGKKPDDYEPWEEFNRSLKEDAEMLEELRARLSAA